MAQIPFRQPSVRIDLRAGGLPLSILSRHRNPGCQSPHRIAIYTTKFITDFIVSTLPPGLDDYPPLPDSLPAPDQRINAGGWSYRCYSLSIYHAWPTTVTVPSDVGDDTA